MMAERLESRRLVESKRAMQFRGARLLQASVLAAIVFGSAPADAIDLPPIANKPVRLDLTHTNIFNWHFDNRNETPIDDNYGEWIQRLDTQLSWDRWSYGFRLDSAIYQLAPTAPYLADGDSARFFAYQKQLVNRYQTSVYPSKFYLSYRTPDLELTLGDFYVQFGRGLVLSLRKIDEVALDTTLRGAKVDYQGQSGKFRYGAVGVLGYTNPVRVDESSGRRLTAPRAWYFAGMPAPVKPAVFQADPLTPQNDYGYPGVLEESYRPDGIIGAHLQGGTRDILIGLQGSLLARGGLGNLLESSNQLEDATLDTQTLGRANRFIETGSVSASLPNLPHSTAVYVEVAKQRLDTATSPFGASDPEKGSTDGHAVYASVSAGGDPVNVLFEARHARRFWPLLANVNPQSAPEFLILGYSAPPTTQPVTHDTEFGFFGTCTTGGRVRVDYRIANNVTTYASVGRYISWGERLGDCGARAGRLEDSDRNDIWDPYVGVQASYDKRRSHVNAWTGVRLDDAKEPFVAASGAETRIFYREAYARYDWFHVLSSIWALQNQGTHRLRAEYQTDAQPWVEGEHYVALQWKSKAIVSMGYEYSDRGDDLKHYFNGSVLYRITPDTSFRLFAGQQRPALRCVSGVCRMFPPFEGAKLEFVARF